MEDSVTFLSPHLIRPFRQHPFRLYEGERLDDFVASVAAHGILTPVIVRKIEPDENGIGYEMLAGHNRRNAAMLIGLEYIPCIVKENLSDEEAWIYVIETNVLQRSFADMLPSEKASVLSIQYSKMFSQGKRNDIIEELKKLNNPDYSRESVSRGSDFHKLKNRDKLGEAYELSGRTVANYVRVASLAEPLKYRMDTGELTLKVSVELSYLSQQEQQMIESVLSENEYKLDGKKAALLREYTGRLNQELTEQILSGEKTRKPKNNTLKPFKLKAKIYSKYFKPETKANEIEQIIDEALSLYFSQQEQKGV